MAQKLFTEVEHIQYCTGPEACNLQTVDIWHPRPTSGADLWIIYIHGGAWRDPEIDASSFQEAATQLATDERIAGLASLNYRLSPYPSHPTVPSQPDDPSRNSKHPDHIEDVIACLQFLQDRYQFKDRFILVGHSCGATLALQVLIEQAPSSVKPCAVVGVDGLYDLVAFAAEAEYCKVLVKNAFGDDRAVWQRASPTSGRFSDAWPHGGLIVIAMSTEDELLGPEQTKLMTKALMEEPKGGLKLLSMAIKGKHDQIWQEGVELVKTVKLALDNA